MVSLIPAALLTLRFIAPDTRHKVLIMFYTPLVLLSFMNLFLLSSILRFLFLYNSFFVWSHLNKIAHLKFYSNQVLSLSQTPPKFSDQFLHSPSSAHISCTPGYVFTKAPFTPGSLTKISAQVSNFNSFCFRFTDRIAIIRFCSHSLLPTSPTLPSFHDHRLSSHQTFLFNHVLRWSIFIVTSSLTKYYYSLEALWSPCSTLSIAFHQVL